MSACCLAYLLCLLPLCEMAHPNIEEIPERSPLRVDSLLMRCIESGVNDVAMRLLKNKLHDIKDALGLLLHHAALYNNEVIAQYLIGLGAEVDLFDYESKTPLMVAVENSNVATVKVLLNGNASIEVADVSGRNALQLLFSSQTHEDMLMLFLERLRRDCRDGEELVERLIQAGSSMYHATFFRDTAVLESFLQHGVDIDSRDHSGATALHAAVELDDVCLVEWLLKNNADVNAQDNCGCGPLYDAAYQGKVQMVRVLLEHGANPNVAEKHYDYTPLFATFAYSLGESEQNNYDACIELLLQHGAIPQNSSADRNTLFDYAMLAKNSDRINLLVARLAILDKLGTSLAKSVMYYNVEEHLVAQPRLDRNYNLCWKLLEFAVYRNYSLFDLLTGGKRKLRVLVRDRTFLSKINYVNGKLGRVYTFYFKPLMKGVADAVRAAKLEDAAIPILCKIFDRNYNQCYNFAREIVGYLSLQDLEQLRRL
ncbi:poly [ADP-ribose] polymerase tankyrase-2-like [Phymastichus coffea]|uniref:poly [ADP-ribose] polymerase tankyrase-2-like n=1 Tax=Phymastichus coffea TaxID=108790 RepID=UPI00273A85A0|nr:poly [ADP-ribose] polymerase tankyrase-2-like [Phymastichus coffea]XP_058802536.1 poly [ADP-ribose] polymerase tankyrase-2-like [Phymastichus coffea]